MLHNLMSEDAFDLPLFLSRVGTTPSRDFTLDLKAFEKQYKYSRTPLGDARRFYKTCADILQDQTSSIDAQYNALRLLKHIAWDPNIFIEHYRDYWEFYKPTILHKNGNIRMAGATLISYFYFGVTIIRDPIGRKREKELTSQEVGLENFFVERILEMMTMENAYVQQHEKRLSASDFCDDFHVRLSTETRDPYLKNIRRGIEELTRGTEFVDKIMREHGHCMKQSSTFPETILWGRWDVCTHHKHKRMLRAHELAGLWGEDIPYSQVHVDKEIRILGDQTSRTFVDLYSYLNPTSHALLLENAERIPSEWLPLLTRAENMGFEHGFRISIGRYELHKEDASKLQEQEQEIVKMISAMHAFVIQVLGAKK